MSKTKKQPVSTTKIYPIHHHDLPLSCPTNKMELWSTHPKVYLPIEKTGKEICPYCGTCFVLQDD